MKSVEIDGRKAALEIFPFEMRQKKIIIDPHKTEKVEVSLIVFGGNTSVTCNQMS